MQQTRKETEATLDLNILMSKLSVENKYLAIDYIFYPPIKNFFCRTISFIFFKTCGVDIVIGFCRKHKALNFISAFFNDDKIDDLIGTFMAHLKKLNERIRIAGASDDMYATQNLLIWVPPKKIRNTFYQATNGSENATIYINLELLNSKLNIGSKFKSIVDAYSAHDNFTRDNWSIIKKWW